MFITIFISLFSRQEIKAIHITGNAQGTTYNITYFASEEIISKQSVDSLFEKIDSSLSLYKPYSLIVQFNNHPRGVLMDEHFKKVIQASVVTSRQTKGLSDITIAPVTEAWGFGAKKKDSIPTNKELKELLRCVGIKNIYTKGDSLLKKKSCVKIDANGIAQGYTVDVLAALFESQNINNYLVEVGGELRVKGMKQPAGTPFKIGIESPSGDDFNTPPMQKIIALKDGALTTSGNYRRYHESKGKRYSHIIDPRTGRSASNEMISITVFAQDATTADGIDNALMLMGVKRALQFVDKRSDLAAFIIFKKPDGTIADTSSTRFKQLFSLN